MIINSLTKNYDPICKVTGKIKRKVVKRDKTIEYFLFDKSVYDYFYEMYPEAKFAKLFYRHKNSCYLNSLHLGEFTMDTITTEFIDLNWKKYCPTTFEYFLEKCDGDVELAKFEHSNRQSTTSLSSFIRRFGEEDGKQKFKEHFDHIHACISGDNHWTNNLDCSLTEHIANHNNVTIEIAREILSGRQSLLRKGYTEEEIKKWFSDKAKLNKRPRTDEEKENWRQKLKITLTSQREAGEFYKTFGCWKACHNFSVEHNIEYTDANRKIIYNKLFNPNIIDYWLLRGCSEEEAVEKIQQLRPRISKQSVDVLDEMRSTFDLSIDIEQPIGTYIVDGIIKSKNIIIEYFGDYWHCNPKIYNSEFLVRGNITAQTKWDSDKCKIQYLEQKGYKVFVIWEYDWKTNKSEILNDFKILLNE